MNSVNDKITDDQPICNVLEKVIATIHYSHLFFFSSQDELEHCR